MQGGLPTLPGVLIEAFLAAFGPEARILDPAKLDWKALSKSLQQTLWQGYPGSVGKMVPEQITLFRYAALDDF